MIAPLYLFKLRKWLKFKPFIGIITDSDYTIMQITKGSDSKYINFKVTSINNKKKFKFKIKAKEGVLNYFKNESQVLFLRGFEYPVKLDNDTSETIFCPCCGTFNPSSYARCFECSNIIWNR